MLVGLSGYAQSGKDSTADVLVSEHGFTRVSFADKLRAAVLALDPCMEFGDLTYAQVLDYYGGYENARQTEHKDEIRRLLQRMGTEVGRTLFGENFWVDQALRDLDSRTDVVITDCRFLNEARAVVSRGGELWRINRPGVGPANDHASEIGLDSWPFDRSVSNDGTLDDLAEKVGLALQRARLRFAPDIAVATP